LDLNDKLLLGGSMILTVSALNRLVIGEREFIVDQNLSILRVPGGYIYEYYDNKKEIKAATFVSTDELRNE